MDFQLILDGNEITDDKKEIKNSYGFVDLSNPYQTAFSNYSSSLSTNNSSANINIFNNPFINPSYIQKNMLILFFFIFQLKFFKFIFFFYRINEKSKKKLRVSNNNSYINTSNIDCTNN